ncbi:hypothetical protein P3X46_035151 [Hevea brasiliensis]|uniref:SHSP domain-containing protein n=1 Tax=Hevea brasiliensis TaxID=3981 RepID=A0ABQ9KDR0_HEVBR|nr:hypothetical protein P3X46_035151 [Hevea brasiliensis]
MEPPVQSTNSGVDTGSESFRESSRGLIATSVSSLTIFGNYFGPHLKEECPPKSILQRRSEGLSTYTSDQLAGLGKLCYYALRKAQQSLAVKLHVLNQFLHGTIPTSENDPTAVYPQFPDLFPPQLHCYKCAKKLKRFKRLTRPENLLLYVHGPRYHAFLDVSTSYDMPVQGAEELPPVKPSYSSHRAERPASILQSADQHVHDVAPLQIVPDNALPPLTVETVSPGMFFFPSCRNNKEWEQTYKSEVALTGSAATGQVGPIIELMDVGESEDAYLFLVSLPGVKWDWEDFSCEIKDDDKVRIKDVMTTGESTVYGLSRTFKMYSKNLCPPGEFSVVFQLPGPVDQLQFSGKVSDGILGGHCDEKETC